MARPLAKIFARHPVIADKAGPYADLFALCYAAVMVTGPRLMAYNWWKKAQLDQEAVRREHAGRSPQSPQASPQAPVPGGMPDQNGRVAEGGSRNPMTTDSEFKKQFE